MLEWLAFLSGMSAAEKALEALGHSGCVVAVSDHRCPTRAFGGFLPRIR
jgi:hypothetical protein